MWVAVFAALSRCSQLRAWNPCGGGVGPVITGLAAGAPGVCLSASTDCVTLGPSFPILGLAVT